LVGLSGFFGRNFYSGEVGLEVGALEFVGLFGVVALGDEDEAVAGGEVGEGFGDSGE